MEHYPTIPVRSQVDTKGEIFWAFDKLDGSNIRAEWTRKNGFHKFGRRKALLDDSNPFLPEAESLILNKYGDALEQIFKKQRWSLVTAFFEFWGANSFAGNHIQEEHDVILFDLRPFKQGILPPNDFVRLTQDIDTPRLLYTGVLTQDFMQSVENGILEGMTFEGVVCKGRYVRKLGRPLMLKIKNRAWLDKLRARCPDEATFERLR